MTFFWVIYPTPTAAAVVERNKTERDTAAAGQFCVLRCVVFEAIGFFVENDDDSFVSLFDFGGKSQMQSFLGG